MTKQPDNGLDAVHTRVRVAMQDCAESDGCGGPDFADAMERLDLAVAECDDPECEICSKVVCPYGDRLHFHNDGCPSCSTVNED